MIGPNYEPEHGVDYTQAQAREPERDIDAITAALESVETGDRVRITAGVDGDTVEHVHTILAHERDVAGFDRRIQFFEDVRDDGWTRVYLTGIGNPDLEPWEVVSYPYHLESKTGYMSDFTANGWVADAKVVEEST